MFNIKSCNFDITMGSQDTTRCSKLGDILLKLNNSTGKNKIVTVYNVRYVTSFVGKLYVYLQQ